MVLPASPLETIRAGPSKHMLVENGAVKGKTKWTHIPFEEMAPVIAASSGRHAEVCAGRTLWKSHILAIRPRLLAGIDVRRISFVSNVPTLKESDHDVVALAVLASPRIATTLHDTFKKATDYPLGLLTHQLGLGEG